MCTYSHTFKKRNASQEPFSRTRSIRRMGPEPAPSAWEIRIRLLLQHSLVSPIPTYHLRLLPNLPSLSLKKRSAAFQNISFLCRQLSNLFFLPSVSYLSLNSMEWELLQHVLILRKKTYSLFSNPSQFDLYYVGQHAWEEKCWAGYVFKMLLSTYSHATQSLLKHRLLYPLLAVPGIAIQTGQLSLKPSCPSWLQGWQIKNHSIPQPQQPCHWPFWNKS